MISIDFETHLIGPDMIVPKPVCLSWYDGTVTGLIVGINPINDYLKKLLESKELIIAHNMKFEMLVIYEWFPSLQDLLVSALHDKRLICTYIYESLINNTRKKPLMRLNLAECVKNYFGEDISESKTDPNAWRLRYAELEDIPKEQWPQEAIDYAIDDSIWAYKIYSLQCKTRVDIYGTLCAAFYLNYMSSQGMIVDKDRVATLKKELLALIVPNYMKLESIGLTKYKITKKKNGTTEAKYQKNIKNLQEYVKLNVPILEKTPKGTISTATESLDHYISQTGVSEEVRTTFRTYLDIIKYEKVLTSFVSRLEKANPRIYTEYTAAVSTGRTSSHGTDNYPSLNIQQMPRSVDNVTWDIRNCFVPRPGFKICSIDYSGLELASAAHQLKSFTKMDNMARIINLGDTPVDMHSMLAYRIMNIKEKTHETYESFIKNKKQDKYKAYRQLAKPINLGFPGGIGYDTMRTLLAKEGIYPRLEVIETSMWENNLTWKARQARSEGFPIRIRQVGIQEFQLVYDELVALKNTMFGLYPDLESFLKEEHLRYCTGESLSKCNAFGEWEKEPMYKFDVNGFKSDWCTYTQFCNGFLMQSPSAVGAKKAMCNIIEEFRKKSDVMRPLAFIHDEIVFEILQFDEMYAIIDRVSEIMIDSMQSVLTSVRIAVEAEVFPYWKKSGGEWSKNYWKNVGDKTLRSL